MGAELAVQRAEGRTAEEAYDLAMGAATAEYGHQEGYSGAINSKGHGFRLVKLPPRWTFSKLQGLLEEALGENVGDLKDNIKWRQGILDQNACKRSMRPAIRKAIADDKRRLKQVERSRVKMAATLAKSGMSDAEFGRLVATYEDKWAEPLCVELSPREAKPSKRGRRVYVFFGYAPS